MASPAQVQSNTQIDVLYEIGAHLSADDPLDESLAALLNFAAREFHCDSCFAYVGEADDLALWVWKNSSPTAANFSKLQITSFRKSLAVSRGPVVISQDSLALKPFPEWSRDPGETSVAVTLISRGRLVGVLHLLHSKPRVYEAREAVLLATAALLIGADIGLSRLEKQNSNLLTQLETRKLVERGKGILQRELGLNEEQAYLALQRQSRQTRKSMKEIAQAVVMSDEVRRSLSTQ